MRARNRDGRTGWMMTSPPNSCANGDAWADVIDTPTIYPEARRKVVRMLTEIDTVG